MPMLRNWPEWVIAFRVPCGGATALTTVLGEPSQWLVSDQPFAMPSSSAVYPAHAFHTELPGGRASGELSLTGDAFRFSTGEREVRLPCAGARLTLGGANDRLVFVAHPSEPGWSIYTSDRSILSDPRLTAHPELLQSLGQIRRKQTRNRLVLLTALLLIVALPLAVALNLDVFTGLAARQVPAQWEERLGKLALDQYELSTALIDDEQAQQLLGKLTGQLTAALPDARYQYHFYIAREPELNAFALPGGYIVLHSELVLRADSAEELLGVVAHEISHVREQHGTRNLIGSAGLALTVQLLIGDSGGAFGTLAAAAPFLLVQKYSRGFEREADREGFALLTRARVNPKGLLSFFEKVQAEQTRERERLRKILGDGGELSMPEFMSTHPTTQSRIAELRELVAGHNGSYQNLGETFRSLQARVRAVSESPATPNRATATDDSKDPSR